jgi:hypothetical protein
MRVKSIKEEEGSSRAEDGGDEDRPEEEVKSNLPSAAQEAGPRPPWSFSQIGDSA